MRPFPHPVYVTRPLLPPLAAFASRLEGIWDSAWLSNMGEQHRLLEQALCRHLKCGRISLFCNGTIALMLAARALGMHGEVVTTPFTFAATPHALRWIGCQPVFADVEPGSLTLSPAAVEAAITPRTGGIAAVHVFGNPCDLDGLADVARRHGLPLLYDGAHAFGLESSGRPIWQFGDATMYSFHATKLFHTAEGGAVACRDEALHDRLYLLKNFGIENEETVSEVGINGKMNEIQAALGVEVLAAMEKERERRSGIDAVYREILRDAPGVSIPEIPSRTTRKSLQYFPVLVDAKEYGMSRNALHDALRELNVYTRKYFYPLCSTYPAYRDLPSADPGLLPVATRAGESCLTLPFYGELPKEHAERIAVMIRDLRKTQS